MNDTSPLNNKTFIITRPKQQAQSLATSLENLGAHVILFPTIEIMPLQNETLKQTFKNIDDDTVVIFVSTNAVKCSKPYWHKLTNTVFAIGSATADALKDAGISKAHIPDTYSSEGLLEHAQLQQCVNKKILIVSGEPSRPLLGEALTQRGADVSHTVCYQQQLPDINDLPSVENLKQRSIDIIISTSQQGLTNLFQLVGISNQDWLNQQQFLIINERMREKLQELGNTRPNLLAKNATHQAITACLHEHFHKR
ncbi:MAG: uroporphyrinogen-III synthase [Gammaproteobacteria bacterium]|nr:uroporphyrinogen-III synthase [Gammaproteobacteria bacterium]MCH9743504.1 uroporphyrinogen-III synthase [Gammaproteobacteria bacterium]